MTIIKRTPLHFDEQYTPIPRTWARDHRVSRRARGLLVELVSHRSGWKISLRSLVTTHEGRDAVSTAMRELIEAGYLVRTQSNEAGRFGEVEYEVRDPHSSTASGSTGHGSTASGPTASGSSAPIRKPGTKETRREESKVSDETRLDVERLLDLLDAELTKNGVKKLPLRNKSNRDAMRLMLDRDQIPEEQIAGAIRWAQADEFWRGNILSASKLREKYETLRAHASRGRRGPAVQDNMARLAQMEAEEQAAEQRGLSA